MVPSTAPVLVQLSYHARTASSALSPRASCARPFSKGACVLSYSAVSSVLLLSVASASASAGMLSVEQLVAMNSRRWILSRPAPSAPFGQGAPTLVRSHGRLKIERGVGAQHELGLGRAGASHVVPGAGRGVHVDVLHADGGSEGATSFQSSNRLGHLGFGCHSMSVQTKRAPMQQTYSRDTSLEAVSGRSRARSTHRPSTLVLAQSVTTSTRLRSEKSCLGSASAQR